jgi:CzcA family heavy metal efflux pump
MMDYLINWALRNRALTLACALILLGVGIYNSLRMQVDVLPDLTSPSVTVMTDAEGMAPVEVENLVTRPIEAALNGAPGVRRIRSTSSVGLSEVWVDFDWGQKVMESRQVVAERLASVVDELPPGVERPLMAPDSSIMGEVMFVGMTSTNHSLMELKKYARGEFRRRILSAPGVAEAIVSGGEERQYQVRIEPTLLAQYGLTLDQVSTALREANQNVSAGVINERGNQWLVLGEGRLRTVEEIGKILIDLREGQPLTIADVARVEIAAPLARGSAGVNGMDGVVIGILKQTGVNTLELTRTLDLLFDDIELHLPAGVSLHRGLFRQADFIETAIANVERVLLEGIVLVILVVFVFLGNVRATLITIVAIPLSLVSAVLFLKGFGVTINTMSLGGMAIAIGALVDDAVIDVENVFRRLRQNQNLPPQERASSLRTVLTASIEIRSSIVFATLIIGLVFIPLFFLSGVEGRLMAPLGLAYLAALFTSLLVAVTVTPVLCYLLLPGSAAVKKPAGAPWVVAMQQGYRKFLGRVIDYPRSWSFSTLFLLLIALLALGLAGRSFLPDFNEGSLTINAVTLPGSSLPESERVARAVEKTLLSFPEVVSVGRRTGRGDNDTHGSDVEGSEFDVNLRLDKRSREEFLHELREELAEIPGVSVTIGQPISHRVEFMLSGSKASVAVKIFGPDLYKLRALADKVQEEMAEVRGVTDLNVEMLSDIPILQTRFEREALARYGLSLRQAADYLQSAVNGLKVGEILEDNLTFDLMVNLRGDEPWRLDTLQTVLIKTPSGAKIPLSALGRVERLSGPNRVSHEGSERKIIISCNTAGRDAVSVVKDCQKKIAPLFEGETEYRVEYGGQFESAHHASRTLLFVGLAVVVGVAMLLQVAFKSMRDALLIMVNLPLALMGGVIGVYVSGGVVSVASLIGFITVFGIAARNGIMLVSHIRHLQIFEGVREFREAVLRGSQERLVPILMTALSAGLALVPLALAADKPGNEIQSPMAIVILFGLLSSMLLNMFIVPTLYLAWGRPVSKQNESEE